jgi:hypothetical protein
MIFAGHDASCGTQGPSTPLGMTRVKEGWHIAVEESVTAVTNEKIFVIPSEDAGSRSERAPQSRDLVFLLKMQRRFALFQSSAP